MMAFAMADWMWEMKMTSNIHCCDTSKKECSHICCTEAVNQIDSLYIHIKSIQEKIYFVKIAKSLDDIFAFETFWLWNKNLTQITSPPHFTKKIKNYSYSDFIGIIQLNI